MKFMIKLTAVALVASAFTAATGHAAILEYAFTGEVDVSVEETNGIQSAFGGLQSGDVFSGAFTIDTMADRAGTIDPGGATTYHQIARFSLTLGPMSTTVVNERAYIRVHNNATSHHIRPLGWSVDFDVDVFSYGFDSFTAIEDGNGWALYELGIWLADTTQTWLTSAELPVLDLSRADLAPFDVFGYRRVDDSQLSFDVTGRLTSLTLIPEPSAVAILLIAGTRLFRRR